MKPELEKKSEQEKDWTIKEKKEPVGGSTQDIEAPPGYGASREKERD
jgi:hypothetical protein